MLAVLVSHLLAEDPLAGTEEAVFPLPAPALLAAAAGVSFDELEADLARTEKELTACSRKVDQVVASTDDESIVQPFKEDMELFLSDGKSEAAAVRKQLQQAIRDFEGLVAWFLFQAKGSKGAPPTPADLFEIWSEFAAQFEECWKGEQRAAARRKFEEAQRARQEQAKKGKSRKLLGGLRSKLKLKFGGSKSKPGADGEAAVASADDGPVESPE
jgi:hypothetical protein